MDRPAAVTPMSPAEIEALALAQARALGLHLGAEVRAGVVTYLGLAAMMAERVMGQALTPEDESGSVFVPVSPRGGSSA